ncbi:TIGR02569 family protein [Leifsonia lichenia]
MRPAEAQPPGDDVLRAFGVSGTPVVLPGGRGLTWRAGHVVLRPAEPSAETEWKSGVLAGLAESDGFTVPRPLRDDSGQWMRDGWEALDWVPGAANPTRVADVVRAGLAFQRAVAAHPEPSFISETDHAWARADRVAWGEEAAPDDPLIAALTAEFRPVDAPSQVIHADLLGNVLFADGRPPAVIDWAPYWRPAGLAAAIAVADAACWHGHPVENLGEDYGIASWRQLLLRALVFRMATLHLLGLWDDEHARRHAPVVRAAIALDR